MWDFFDKAVNNPRDTSMNDYFDRSLDIGNVAITKLTQALFLINPKYFIPIDDRTEILFPGQNIKKLKKIIQTEGFSGYLKLLSQLQAIFKGCEYWEMNRLAYAIIGEDLQPDFDNWWYQISSQWDGEGSGDYIDEWFEESRIAIGYTEGDFFSSFKTLAKGKIIIAKKGMNIFHGIGIISGDSITSAEGLAPVTRDIIWILKDRSKEMNHFTRKTLRQTQKDEVYDQINEFFPEIWEFLETFSNEPQSEVATVQQGENSMSTNYPTNLILYGPPGTGKTYSTINNALSIIENRPVEELENVNTKELVTRFEKYQKTDYVEFVTFHQSYSYEDFMEGIKASAENGEVSYDISDGIFKRISKNAEKNYNNSRKPAEVLQEERSIDQLITEFADSVRDQLDNGEYRLNKSVFIMDVETDAFRYS